MKTRSLSVLVLLLAAACQTEAPPAQSWTPFLPGDNLYAAIMQGDYAGARGDARLAAQRYTAAIGFAPSIDRPALAARAHDYALEAGEFPLALELARIAGPSLDRAALTLQIAGLIGLSPEPIALKPEPILDADAQALALAIAWRLAAAGDFAGAAAQVEAIREVDASAIGLKRGAVALLAIAQGADADAASGLQGLQQAGRLPVAYLALLAGAQARSGDLLTARRNARFVARDALNGRDIFTIAAAEALHGDQTPPPPDPRALLAQQLVAFAIERGPMADSLGWLTLARALAPQDAALTFVQAQFLQSMQRDRAALETLEQIDPAAPHAFAALIDQIAILQREERSEEARALALAHRDRSPRVLEILAALYTDADDYPAAEAVLTDFLASAPETAPSWRAHFSRGAARERQGKLPEAESDFREAIRLAPTEAEPLNYLGYMLIDQTDRVEEGFELVRRAFVLAPRAGHIVDSLGWAYLRLDRVQEAIDFLERAVELDPGQAEIIDHLGDAYWESGRRREAVFQWRRALSFSPDPDRAARLEIKIKDGLKASPAP